MKYVVEMGSGALIYVPSFIKTASAIRKLMGRYSKSHTAMRISGLTCNGINSLVFSTCAEVWRRLGDALAHNCT
jgi:hypothetical protein